ncbi:uncharacterized protein LOC114704711 [Peromyscus leucopus]|uniref:uncharacterized protein LOC114704711 n=1 Tax=Peromyscus leucopus TaxID=10041 RepID=UPI0018859851|nr:uncharacterized protein LOC114704711 [Peromyscus leucopus]
MTGYSCKQAPFQPSPSYSTFKVAVTSFPSPRSLPGNIRRDRGGEMSKIGRRWGRLAWLPAMLAAGIWSGRADGKARRLCWGVTPCLFPLLLSCSSISPPWPGRVNVPGEIPKLPDFLTCTQICAVDLTSPHKASWLVFRRVRKNHEKPEVFTDVRQQKSVRFHKHRPRTMPKAADLGMSQPVCQPWGSPAMGGGPSEHHHEGRLPLVPEGLNALLLWACGGLDTQERSPERQITQLIHPRAGKFYAGGATQ